jgi:arabinosaccharide transport system substrate-binding protein
MRNRNSVVILLVSTLLLFGGTIWGGGQQDTAATDGTVSLEFWTFQELHLGFYETMAEKWNSEGRTPQISIEANVLPYDELHDSLLVALQSGVGAPDIVDIEISRFPNYLRGKIQLEAMNEYTEPVRDKFVDARFDIYSRDGNVYGLPFHVGASVMYYNTEILDAAGVNVDDIDTWEDFVAAGRMVKERTGKAMTTFEITEQFSFWQMISQQGSDLFNADGTPAFDNDINVRTLEYMLAMIKEGIAVGAPGGFHHAEEYYGFMNDGGAASVAMPMWYMGRFLDYMPDLDQKIVIRPLPRWTANGFRSAGMGGTGTAVTSQASNIDVAKEFLAYAKLSEAGNIALWTELGFDPPRWDVWDHPTLNEPTKFSKYFLNESIFGTLLEVRDEINPVNVVQDLPEGIGLVRTALFQALEAQSATPREALQAAAQQLR